MNTTLYQNRPQDTQNWTNLYLEPHGCWNYYVNINLHHQHGISAAESQTSPVEKSKEKRMFSQAIQVTAPSINYQTTQIPLDLIEHFIRRLGLGDTFNAVCLSVSW